MYVREAHNSDEAWMLEKLNQSGYDASAFRSRDFLIGIEENTDERVAFGRLRYHRSDSDEELVELTSFVVLDRATADHACELIVELVDTARTEGYDTVYAFPHEGISQYKAVGFETTPKGGIPDVMQERKQTKSEHLRNSLESLRVNTRHVSYDTESDAVQNQSHAKPQGEDVTEEEVSELKDELGISDDSDTKYST